MGTYSPFICIVNIILLAFQVQKSSLLSKLTERFFLNNKIQFIFIIMTFKLSKSFLLKNPHFLEC